MKKIMKVKNVLLAMVFSVAVLGGYQAYEQVSLTNAESFLLENVEALAAEGESGAVSKWCQKKGVAGEDVGCYATNSGKSCKRHKNCGPTA